MARPNGTNAIKPWQHKASGLWCIKRKGRRYYLGRSSDEAVLRYQQFRNRIERGLKIPDLDEDVGEEDLQNVESLSNHFLAAQDTRVQSNELSRRSFNDYVSTCRRFSEFVGKFELVDDLTPTHFADYRAEVAKTRNIVGVGNEVTRIKTIFKWADDNGLLASPVNFGTEFKRPKKKDVRLHKHRQGPKTFAPAEIWMLTDEFGVHYRAMAFLGINCGFGPSDCSNLAIDEVQFGTAAIAGIRPKTGELRFATLWPETVDALKLSLARRPEPANKEFATRFFLTHDGREFLDAGSDKNIITKRTTATLQRLNLHVPGKSFYWLRHTFRTVADKVGDDVAVNWIMGHVDDRVAKNYIHDAPEDRIRKVTDHVYNWLSGGLS